MILDKNGKIFGKVNIIDVCVVVAIIVAVVGIAARFVTTAAEDVKKKVELSYVVRIDGIRIYTVDALCKKGLLTDSKTGSDVGEIVDVVYEPFKNQLLTASGETVTIETPERYTALVTVKAVGNESDSGYFVGENIELSVGSTLTLSSKYVNTTGTVNKIEKLN